jgi:hypothetical protein
MKPKKSWAEKLNSSKPHQVKPAPIDMAGMKAGQIMLVPSPRIIDDYIRTIPEGESLDVPALRKELAREYGAEVTCPITTGILLRIVAEAAYEARGRGEHQITPFWRVLDEEHPTASKLACGPAFIARRRKEEGVRRYS